MATKTETIELLFDNGGGILLQCDAYTHSYGDGKQAAEDVKALLAGEDPAGWDGNQPEFYDPDLRDLHCSDAHHYDLADLRAAMADTAPLQTSGHAETGFLRAFTGRAHIND